MSISAIYILDVKGKVLISRNYRGDIDMGVIEKFMPLVMEREDDGNMAPIVQTQEATFCFVKVSNLYVVSATRINANVTLVFAFLHKLVSVAQDYFKDINSKRRHKLEIAPRPPIAVTNAVSWRSEGIKYRKNDKYFWMLLKVSISWRILMGQEQECGARGCQIHQCVRLSRFENDRTISFIPPDGEFELMSYRLNTHVKPLIWIESVIERHAHSRVEYMVKAKSQFKRGQQPTMWRS
ncbi:AP-1 complex subunit mu-1 [Penaeus vannamei]|uniref:AP-1 complex subunit mu-1 n=1 Tax=Penaeus vannamei TaxID=6689 RepID=A0A423T3H4_PENVA|nr:AP-1 complex subunit mu-1 [Penaeus vannamei]